MQCVVDIQKLLRSYGKVGEVRIIREQEGSKSLAFVTMDYRSSAQIVKDKIHNTPWHGSVVQIELSKLHQVRITHLNEFVTNELLYEGMSKFGKVEQAVVARHVDTGNSCGWGIVEFATHAHALAAIEATNKQNLLLTHMPIPVEVEWWHEPDCEVGMPHLPGYATDPRYLVECKVRPRFAKSRTLEYAFSYKWRELFRRQEMELEVLKKQHELERDALREEVETLYEREREKFERRRGMKSAQMVDMTKELKKGLEADRKRRREASAAAAANRAVQAATAFTGQQGQQPGVPGAHSGEAPAGAPVYGMPYPPPPGMYWQPPQGAPGHPPQLAQPLQVGPGMPAYPGTGGPGWYVGPSPVRVGQVQAGEPKQVPTVPVEGVPYARQSHGEGYQGGVGMGGPVSGHMAATVSGGQDAPAPMEAAGGSRWPPGRAKTVW